MPIYEYECLSCGKRTEVLQKMADAPLAACPNCGGEVKKLISAPSFQLKGSGWYATDYGSKKSGGGSSEPKQEGKSESKSEGASESKAESKAEGKPESKPEKAASESKGSGGGGGGSSE
jgi:putative FmdB family regulatory protein